MRNRLHYIPHSIQSAFIFLLIGLFAITSVSLTLVGARVYRKVTDSAAQNSDSQITLSYLCNKLRAFDALDHVQLAEREGVQTLCLYETIDGERYETTIYAYQGAIWERFTLQSEPFEPDDGERLTSAESLDFSLLAPDLIQATIRMASGESRTLRIALRAGTAKEAD